MTEQPLNDPATGGGCPVAHGAGDLTRLFGPGTESDQAGIYERLRKEHGSVAPVLLEGDVPAWLVLGYRDARRVLDNPRQFSRDARTWRDWQEGRIEETSPLIPMLGWRPDCVSQDGEAHRRLRGAVNDGLLAASSRGVRRHATFFANQLIGSFSDVGRADLVSEYSEYLPMLVLTRILGLPAAEGRRLAESSIQVLKGGEDALVHNGRIMEILTELAERKSAEPGSDFTSALLAHPAGLDLDEVISHLRLVLIAGYNTTSNLLARVLQLVLTDTARLSGLVSGQLNITAVMEQAMWDTPPLAVLPGRFAAADLELGGHQLQEGDLLVLGLTAGNVDPEIRPDPTVSVQGNQSHLAFSAGPHECPGQNIGQSIIEVAVDVLLHRLVGLRLAVPAEELSSTASTWESRLDSLPVEFAI
ncbi:MULTISPECIES: cytochrome P450 [Streptomyces]|uniref:Cytochrome P450 n=1 Tax=Streptomyces doudnae TaxID=3075536 RepID=A0ABD5EGE6_9ACTN|nr:MULTISPECIES: cytochrome P450 [unclassified Streptomyces]MDT0433742.1 cytochrome P450 [Streptomyces sp. DSM 41981]MYQ62708.1 cytochrome P450 [Streptomyces sp. SID4950]SCD42894.1 Cytochrome P450 [Streptomyces sp. SolWspMP-5a-2]